MGSSAEGEVGGRSAVGPVRAMPTPTGGFVAALAPRDIRVVRTAVRPERRLLSTEPLLQPLVRVVRQARTTPARSAEASRRPRGPAEGTPGLPQPSLPQPALPQAAFSQSGPPAGTGATRPGIVPVGPTTPAADPAGATGGVGGAQPAAAASRAGPAPGQPTAPASAPGRQAPPAAGVPAALRPRDVAPLGPVPPLAVERTPGTASALVEIRRGPEADDVAGRTQARAATVDGRVFLPDRHGPFASPAVQGLVAHELVHVQSERARSGGRPRGQEPDADREERHAVAVEAAVRSGTLPGPVVVPLPRARAEGVPPTPGDELAGWPTPGDEQPPGAEMGPRPRATSVPRAAHPGALVSPGDVGGAGPPGTPGPRAGVPGPGDGGVDTLGAAAVLDPTTPGASPARVRSTSQPPGTRPSGTQPPSPFAGLPPSGFLAPPGVLAAATAHAPAAPQPRADGSAPAAGRDLADLAPVPTSRAAVATAGPLPAPPLPAPLLSAPLLSAPTPSDSPLSAPSGVAGAHVARAPEAPGQAGEAGSGEEQLERLYRLLSDRLRHDLLVERERSGGLVDLAWR